MRILKRILLAIMVMCLCASAGISLAFAEGESSAEGYTGTRYTVTGGAAGGQPLWFGNATPVNYAEAGTEVNIEYTVKTNAMSGSPDDGSAIAGLCRVFKELGNCWFNTAGVGYCGWNEGYNWQTLFEVGATYKIRFYNLTAVAYSFSIIKTVGGADTDITSALSTTATWANYGETGYFGIGILNFAGTFEFDNVAIYNQNGTNLGITNKDNTISTVVATEIKPEQPGESGGTEEPGEEIVLPDYKGNRYDVVMGTWGGNPVAFGNSKALTTDSVYLQYTVVSNSMAGGQLGLLRGNGATLWFNTAGTTYANYADGHSYADLFTIGATYTIKYYDFNADTYSFAIYKEVDGEVTDITNYLTTTPTFNANSSGLRVFGMGAVNAGGTIELTNFAIFDGNMNDLGAAKYTEDISTFTATVINPVTFDEVEYNGGTYTVTNSGFLSTLYFGNKTAVSAAAGTKVFLEYEVESASTGATQWGMVETSTPSAQFAFTGGAMKFANGKACQLLEAGASYKYEWSVTESGVTIKGLKTSADGTLTDIVAHLDAATGDLVANAYYGLWLSEGNTGEFKLVNVKCYDGEGKDLGFISNQGSVGATKDGETEDVVFDDVEYKSVLTYDIILNADPIFFGNKTAVSTEVGTKVFIEYKVAAAGPGKNVLFMLIIIPMLVPSVVSLTPQYLNIVNLNLIGSWWALFIPYVAGNQIASIFLYRTFMAQQPRDLYEAAAIDGAGVCRAYISICLPLSVPIMMVQSVAIFAAIYNDYLWPLMIFVDNAKKSTLMPQLTELAASVRTTAKGSAYALYLLSGIPLVFTTVISLKFFINGDFAAGLKL